MSGGSLEYLYERVGEAATKVKDWGQDVKRPNWIAFGTMLQKVADALHDVEWVMSCDFGPEGADKSIALLVNPADERKACVEELEAAVRMANELLSRTADSKTH